MIRVTLFCTLRESENTRTRENCTRFELHARIVSRAILAYIYIYIYIYIFILCLNEGSGVEIYDNRKAAFEYTVSRFAKKFGQKLLSSISSLR